jgi:hypothetical protein
MLYILLAIGIIGLIWGEFQERDGILIFSFVVSFISFIAILIAGGAYNYDSSTINSRLSVLEEQNTTVLTQIEPLVQQALEYESNTYKDFKLDAAKIIAFTQLYPDLKANDFLKKQIDIILVNQEEIKQLKLNKASLNAYSFWLWTPKVVN